jgi:uncharacterized protein YuzB (UPF0349 family)
MKISDTEWDIIEHRLGASDAIAEVLEFEEGMDPVAVEERVDELYNGGPNSFNGESKLDLAIIRDCLDGCTMFADIDMAVFDGEITQGKMMAYYKAAYSLEEKFGVEVKTA